MPNCRLCSAPVFFLSEQPTRFAQFPKMLPIDVDPDDEGTVAIYEVPNPDSVSVIDRAFKGVRQRFIRRIYGEARRSFITLGGVVYRIHFDSCPGRRNR
jgi:hypothetical protein